jgi:general nucleoside transport system permease protein
MISRITLQTQRSAATSSVLAVVGACLAGAILLLLTGHNPWTAYRLIVERGLLDWDGLSESLKKMAPLLIITAGLLTCLRAGIWNIGIDGQVVIGAIACGVVAGELVGDLPRALLLITGAVVGGLAGGLWALGPAVLTARYHHHDHDELPRLQPRQLAGQGAGQGAGSRDRADEADPGRGPAA